MTDPHNGTTLPPLHLLIAPPAQPQPRVILSIRHADSACLLSPLFKLYHGVKEQVCEQKRKILKARMNDGKVSDAIEDDDEELWKEVVETQEFLNWTTAIDSVLTNTRRVDTPQGQNMTQAQLMAEVFLQLDIFHDIWSLLDYFSDSQKQLLSDSITKDDAKEELKARLYERFHKTGSKMNQTVVYRAAGWLCAP